VSLPIGWLHEISMFQNCLSPFLAWANTPIRSWGLLIECIPWKVIDYFDTSSRYLSTMANSTLIILFSEMLKFSKIIFFQIKKKNIVKENSGYLTILLLLLCTQKLRNKERKK
jgi:hypothetical protein